MKRILLALFIILVSSLLTGENILQKTLPNGMQIVVKENNLNESVGLYCFVKTGSVNEGKYLGAGISHYLEHVVSSGTTTFRTEDEYEQLGKDMGAIVNAYTSQAATAFYLTVDKVYADDALKALSEQMQFCVCDSFEVAREREVILKEIVMRSTPAPSKVYQRKNELVFPNSNKRYPVIGYTNLYKTITRDELEDYYKRRYAPNNMIFVAVGAFEADDMLKKIEDSFIDFPRRQLEPVFQPIQNKREGTIIFTEEFAIQQPDVSITTIIAATDYTDVLTLNAALEILFGKRQSPIRYKLVEELQLVNKRGFYAYVDASPSSPEGEITISIEAKRTEDINEIIAVIDEEIEKFSKSGFTKEQIENIINRTKAQKLLRTPGVSSDANNIGWSMMMYNVPDYFDTPLKVLESLTPDDLSFQLRKHLLPKNRVIFRAVPEGDKEKLEEVNISKSEKTEIAKVEINKNLTLLHKMNTEKPIIKGVLYLPITTDYEKKENDGALSHMLKLMFKGSKKFNSLEISEWKEDHVISFDISSNAKGTFIEFKCLKSDYPHFKKMLFDAFNNPTFEENEINLSKEEIIANFKRSQSRAGTAHKDHRNKILFNDAKSGNSSEIKRDILLGITRDDLVQLHKEYFKAEKMIITLFGDIKIEEAEEIAIEMQKNIPQKKIKAEKIFTVLQETDGIFINKYEFEQVNIDICTSAPPLNSEERKVMSLINTILSGARGRLHQAVRGRNNLAYYAYPQYYNSENYGSFKLTSQTSIDKKDDLIEVMKNELVLLMNEKVSIDEINGAAEEQEKMMKAMLNENSLPYYITYYESQGLGYDYSDMVTDIYKEITPEQILEIAQKYFSKTAVVVSEPNEDVELMVE